jgi:hypothetical protein
MTYKDDVSESTEKNIEASETLETENQETENIWPWDAAATEEAQEVVPAESQSEALQPEGIDVGTAVEPVGEIAPDTSETMFATSAPKSKPHLEISWDSQVFQNETPKKTEDIKFDWGNLFGDSFKRDTESVSEPESEHEPKSDSESIEPLYAVHPDDDDSVGISEDDFDFSFSNGKQTDKILDDRTKQYHSTKGIEPPRRFTATMPPIDEEPVESEFFAKQQQLRQDEPAIEPIPDFRESYKNHIIKKQDADEAAKTSPTENEIANLGIFDTEVASPFEPLETKADSGIVAPFDLSDESLAALFAPTSVATSQTVEPLTDEPTDEPEPPFSTADDTLTSDTPTGDTPTGDQLTELAETEPEPESETEPDIYVPNFFDELAETQSEAEPELETEEEIAAKEADAARQTAKIQDIVSQPVIFPFDEDTGYLDPDTSEPEPEDVSYDKPEDESVVYTEPSDEDYNDESGTKRKKKSKSKKTDGTDGTVKKYIGLIVLVDILVILVVIAGACFAIIHFAPDSGVANLLNSGISKVTDLVGITDKDAADEDSESEITDADVEVVPPTEDKDALVNSQAEYFNKNIAEVVYDTDAKFDPAITYTIEGVTSARPIEQDYWTTDRGGLPVFYDETAVGCVIKFNSELVAYTGGQQSDILSTVETSSREETELADYAASLTGLVFKRLGIGDILTDGTYYYVFTNETVIETRDGTPQEIITSKVYKLVPAITTMKITEIETIS